MPKRIKQNKPVRQRTWRPDDWDTVSRQNRARREENMPQVAREPKDYFTDIEPNGLVVSPYGVLAFVYWNGEEHLCKVDESLIDGKSSILAPGDLVHVECAETTSIVTAVRPRRTKLSRPSIAKDREQVFAANIDHVVIVASTVKPNFNPGLIDRYLVAAQAGGVSPILCVNKIDLVGTVPDAVQLYTGLNMPIVSTSCKSGAGIGELKELLRGKTGVLTGHSGVGKSSLINALDAAQSVFTQDVSDSTNKGRHTTTSSRMYELPGGTRIIDTPGIRQLGLWGVTPAELDYFFHELALVAGGCHFRDCTHTHEPKCAVRDAVEKGDIPRARYDSYVRIRQSMSESTS